MGWNRRMKVEMDFAEGDAVLAALRFCQRVGRGAGGRHWLHGIACPDGCGTTFPCDGWIHSLRRRLMTDRERLEWGLHALDETLDGLPDPGPKPVRRARKCRAALAAFHGAAWDGGWLRDHAAFDSALDKGAQACLDASAARFALQFLSENGPGSA